MANRRKRKQRAEDKARQQKMIDDLALALASDGVTQTVAKPVQSPLSFSIQGHLDGSDKEAHWPNQLGWLQYRAGYRDRPRMLKSWGGLMNEAIYPTQIIEPKQGSVDPIDQMLEALNDEESAEALPADDEQ